MRILLSCLFVVFAAVPAVAAEPGFRWEDISDKSVKLYEGDRPVLVYNYGVITGEHVPEKDHRRTRACYIHPVYGLDGEVLTDDFPKDHYHHHGIFWTWPHVEIDGKQHDLWAGASIRQQFVRWLDREAGADSALLAVENGWFVGNEKVMAEEVRILTHPAGEKSRSIDLDFTWTPVGKPITLWGAGGKSYGGLTMRFKPGPRETTTITVPSGPTTADLPNTPLAWADFTSQFGDGDQRSGAAIFVPRDHPDYPPTWLTRHYGPLCVGWPGVKAKTFPPGEPIRLHYRIWIHADAPETAEIGRAYEAYCHPAP